MEDTYDICFKYIWDRIDCHVYVEFNSYESLLAYYIEYRNMFLADSNRIYMDFAYLPAIVQEKYNLIGEDDAAVFILEPASVSLNSIIATKEVVTKLKEDYNSWLRRSTIDNILSELG